MRRRWIAAGVACALLIAVVLALAVKHPGDPRLFPSTPGAAPVSVYLIGNGYHTSLVVPTARLLAHSGPSAQAAALASAHAPFTEIGWGDAKFYVETGLSPRRALDGLRAFFAPNNPSAVMLAPLRAAPDQLWSTGVVRLELSDAGFERMAASLDHSFALKGGALQGFAAPDGWFFKSVEHFSIVHLCNHWAAERLNAAGVPVRPVLDTLPAGLVFDLETDGVTVHRNAHR